MKGRRVPPKAETSPPVFLPSAPLTREMLEDALQRMPEHQNRVTPSPAPQWLYDAAPLEWKPLLMAAARMPEPTPVERGVLAERRKRR